MFLNSASEFKRHRFWCPDSKKVIQSQDVTFNEIVMCFPKKESAVPTDDQQDGSKKVELKFPSNALKVERQYLILLVRIILKKPTLTTLTSQVLKSSRLQMTIPLLVTGHEEP